VWFKLDRSAGGEGGHLVNVRRGDFRHATAGVGRHLVRDQDEEPCDSRRAVDEGASCWKGSPAVSLLQSSTGVRNGGRCGWERLRGAAPLQRGFVILRLCRLVSFQVDWVHVFGWVGVAEVMGLWLGESSP